MASFASTAITGGARQPPGQIILKLGIYTRFSTGELCQTYLVKRVRIRIPNPEIRFLTTKS